MVEKERIKKERAEKERVERELAQQELEKQRTPGPLAPGSTARIVSSPGIDQVSIPPSCDSNNYVLVRVGQTVRVTRQCPHVDRFCIRADDGNVEDGSVLGCALRAQLEPNGRANE